MITKYIKDNSHRSMDSLREYTMFGIEVNVINPLPDDVDFSAVIEFLQDTIPEHFVYNIDVVYVGDFDFMKEREINALYRDGAIYISNDQDNEQDMIDDIVHEIGHALEENFSEDVYADMGIIEEFVLKRSVFKERLAAHDIDVSDYDFGNIKFSENFDKFLHHKLGYDMVDTLSTGIFLDPYSITSLREYFASGFETYYLDNRDRVKDICPVLYPSL